MKCIIQTMRQWKLHMFSTSKIKELVYIKFLHHECKIQCSSTYFGKVRY